MFCLLRLKRLPWPYGLSLAYFSMGINCMSLAVWLGAERKCSATVVGLDMLLGLLGLSMVRRRSLNRSFKRHLVSPIYCKLQRLH